MDPEGDPLFRGDFFVKVRFQEQEVSRMRRVLLVILMGVSSSLGCATKQSQPTNETTTRHSRADSSEAIVRKAVTHDDTQAARGWLTSAAAKNGITPVGR